MSSPYHAGELEVQARAGVLESASKIGRSIRDAVPLSARWFLGEQRMAILATVDDQGAVWASLVSGAAGFIAMLDERTLRIAATPSAGDPLAENLARPGFLGLLAIDFASRRRMRVNGTGETDARGGIVLHVKQAYANCPKYIHPREIAADDAGIAPAIARRDVTLNAAQRVLISRADTFFVASFHPEGGADASHRGGPPGFVQAVDPRMLAWPDFPGNTMFQTLGNIAANSAAGLLFVDFERGTTLQLTGKARIRWGEGVRTSAGADRRIELSVAQVIESEGASRLRWRGVEPADAPGDAA